MTKQFSRVILSVWISTKSFNLLSSDELKQILDSLSKYVSIFSVLDILSTSINIKSFVSCDGSQLVVVEVHKEKI
jgi:hypothetical protein